jgi:DnaJ-class molecular chaperone
MCHQCKGKGSASTDLRCSICEGSGRIEQGHPLIAFLDEVVNDKLKSLLEKYNFAKIEELKK